MDIVALSNLLNSCDPKDDGRHNYDHEPTSSIASNAITSSIVGSSQAGLADNNQLPRQDNSNDIIWNEDEVPHEEAIDPLDTRPSPRCEIYFRQNVGTEDMFLRMSNKTQSSADCTHVVVKVHFPGCNMRELELDVTTNRVKVESPDKKLHTYLPFPVDEELGEAKWDAEEEILIITLPIRQTDWQP